MSEKESIGKRIILEFLDFIRFKVESDTLTMEDTESIAKVLEENMELSGTADDFARFYGKSKTNVTTVIDRKMLPRPKRRVLYSFRLFRQAIPKSWRDGHK